MSKHKARYKLWICVGYTLGKRSIAAIDVISAETRDDAMRAFYDKPEIAAASIAVTEIQQIATGRLERTWRTLRFKSTPSPEASHA